MVEISWHKPVPRLGYSMYESMRDLHWSGPMTSRTGVDNAAQQSRVGDGKMDPGCGVRSAHNRQESQRPSLQRITRLSARYLVQVAAGNPNPVSGRIGVAGLIVSQPLQDTSTDFSKQR